MLVNLTHDASACGVLWFLHIAKTGGGTVRHMISSYGQHAGWDFIDLWSLQKGKVAINGTTNCAHGLMTQPDMALWKSDPRWKRDFVDKLEQAEPRLVVHQHTCGPSMRTLLPQLQAINRSLARKGRCRLELGTVLREPVSLMRSRLDFFSTPLNKRREVIDQFAEHLIYAIVDPRYRGNLSAHPSGSQLAASAKETLDHFRFLGETTMLGDSISQLLSFMGYVIPDGFKWEKSNLPTAHVSHHGKHDASELMYTYERDASSRWLYSQYFNTSAPVWSLAGNETAIEPVK